MDLDFLGFRHHSSYTLARLDPPEALFGSKRSRVYLLAMPPSFPLCSFPKPLVARSGRRSRKNCTLAKWQTGSIMEHLDGSRFPRTWLRCSRPRSCRINNCFSFGSNGSRDCIGHRYRGGGDRNTVSPQGWSIAPSGQKADPNRARDGRLQMQENIVTCKYYGLFVLDHGFHNHGLLVSSIRQEPHPTSRFCCHPTFYLPIVPVSLGVGTRRALAYFLQDFTPTENAISAGFIYTARVLAVWIDWFAGTLWPNENQRHDRRITRIECSNDSRKFKSHF